MAVTTREQDWDDVEAMDTGDLVNLMLANFNPHVIDDDDIEPYRQNSTYYAAVCALNKRLPSPTAAP